MKPFTKRGCYISRVLSLREARERVRGARRGAREALLVAGEIAVRGVAAEIATWGVAIHADADDVKPLTVGALFGAEWRVVVEEHGDRREARGNVTRVDSRPDGFRLEIRLKNPLRHVTNEIPARPEA